MTTPTKARVAHQSPGRLRLRVPGKRNNQQFFDAVAERARTMPSVTSVETNPTTGSVLVQHRGGMDNLLMEAISAGLREFIDIEMPEAVPLLPVATKLVNSLFHLDDKVKNVSIGNLDARSAAVTGLLLAGVLQLVRGNWLGPAIPLFWYAIQAAGLVPQPAARSGSAMR